MRADEIFAQHERLNVSLDRLSLLVAAPLDEVLPEGRVRVVLEAEIGTLREALRAHFEFEEEGGYLSQVLKGNPRLASQVDILKGEHPRLLAEADALARTLAQGPVSAMREAVQTFLRRLNGHERREASLLQASPGSSPLAEA